MPIGHITNGVHVLTWLAPQMHQVYDRHSGPTGTSGIGDPGFWEDIEESRRRRTLGNAPDAQGPAARYRQAARGQPG